MAGSADTDQRHQQLRILADTCTADPDKVHVVAGAMNMLVEDQLVWQNEHWEEAVDAGFSDLHRDRLFFHTSSGICVSSDHHAMASMRPALTGFVPLFSVLCITDHQRSSTVHSIEKDGRGLMGSSQQVVVQQTRDSVLVIIKYI